VSKYLHFESEVFKDRGLLLAALADLGFAEVEEGNALALYGYEGSRRDETAELVVRRRHVGRASNDLGFRRTAEGFVPVISEYDQRTLLGGRFLVRLRTAYGERAVEAITQRLHGTALRSVGGGLVTVRVRF
jgi:Protein of unknown function (DUF1257)